MMTSIGVPQGQTSVKVTVVDNGARISGPISMFMEPPLLDHLQAEGLEAPAYVFLVEHEALERKVVFDLGIRKEIRAYAPSVIEYHKAFTLKPGKDVFEVLQDGGINLKTVEAVIWRSVAIELEVVSCKLIANQSPSYRSRWNPAGFPSSTDLVVGPGFRETELPGFPENQDAKILQADYDGRTLRQIDFDIESKGLRIGGLRAVDWFGDGSFYLLETRGHTIDHVAGLARTSVSPPTFILMGGDLGHHPSQWRPNSLISIPKELDPSPLGPDSQFNIRRNVCPGELFATKVHRCQSHTMPFTQIREGHPYDVNMARDALSTTEAFDADDKILVIMPHDWTLLKVMDYFPQSANGWYNAQWKERGRWGVSEGLHAPHRTGKVAARRIAECDTGKDLRQRLSISSGRS